MNKSEIVAEVAEKTGITQKDTSAVIEAFFQTVRDGLAEDKKITFVGFGTFEVRDRSSRKGRNPQTGEEITIPASKVPAFKAGKGLKDAVKKA